MSLTGVARRLTAAERAREPRSLAVVAWFDGHAQGAASPRRVTPHEYPRRLDHTEAASWREGWADGWREARCLDWHGFIPHHSAPDHPNVRPPAGHDYSDLVLEQIREHTRTTKERHVHDA